MFILLISLNVSARFQLVPLGGEFLSDFSEEKFYRRKGYMQASMTTPLAILRRVFGYQNFRFVGADSLLLDRPPHPLSL